jgi:hypothetical protein
MAYRLISADELLDRAATSGPVAERALTAEQRQFAAGFAAANDRIAAVMESKAGRDNPGAAVFMLTETNATAENIIAKLPNFGRGAFAPAGAARASEDPIKLWGDVQGDPQDASDRGSRSDAEAVWGDVLVDSANGGTC